MTNGTLLAVAVLSAVLIHFLMYRYARRCMPLYAAYTFFGTASHEIAHWAVALLTFGRPTSISLFPHRIEGKRWELGSVSCSNIAWYNSFPIGIAPVILVPLAFYLYVSDIVIVENLLVNMLIKTIGALILIGNAIPSKDDFNIAFRHPAGIALYVVVAVLYYAQSKGYVTFSW